MAGDEIAEPAGSGCLREKGGWRGGETGLWRGGGAGQTPVAHNREEGGEMARR